MKTKYPEVYVLGDKAISTTSVVPDIYYERGRLFVLREALDECEALLDQCEEAMEGVKYYVIDLDVGHKHEGRQTKPQRAINNFNKLLTKLKARRE